MKRICLGLVFALFAPLIAAQNTTAIQQAERACGPSNVNFTVKTNVNSSAPAAAQPGKAQIYVVEEWTPAGVPSSGRSPTVRIGMDGKWMGADQGNSYFSFAVEPGEHHLCVNWQPGLLEAHHATTALYGFNAKPGQTYFFRVSMPSLPNGFGILLNPSNADEAQLLLAQYPQAISRAKK